MSKGSRLISMALVILGVLVMAASLIYSILEKNGIDIYRPEFYLAAGSSFILIVVGILVYCRVNRVEKNKLMESASDDVSLETIVLSFAMVNQEPRKKIQDLHFYLMSENITDISLRELKLMVDKALLNIKMDMIKPSLKAKLFTEEGELRKFRFASDFCPKCGVFKNYHKECKFCGYHEMAK